MRGKHQVKADRMQESEYITRSDSETFDLARKLSEKFQGEEVVLLTGELGAGKTVFTKGLAAGLGLTNPHEVCSPSFTLINIYPARVPIVHMDLYRLSGPSDIFDLGWEDYLGRGVIVVEWAEKMDFDVPAIRVTIRVEADESRRIRISGPSDAQLRA